MRCQCRRVYATTRGAGSAARRLRGCEVVVRWAGAPERIVYASVEMLTIKICVRDDARHRRAAVGGAAGAGAAS
eukprot:COSAG02_NODE_2216_length_9487_cov_916.793460_6_plen_74_part_00